MKDWPLPKRFHFAGDRCGIRGTDPRKDLALLVSEIPASAAGVFTQSRVCAAPVQVSRHRVPAADVRGVIVCSGNANACTGPQGLRDALRMTDLTAELLGCQPRQVLVCSTGVIGRPLPMDRVEAGIRQLIPQLREDNQALHAAAEAILTTDTRSKIAARQLTLAGQEVRLLGLAKGAAMIGPHLATMLAFVLTDAEVAPGDLDRALRQAVDRSFNCISVEGHTSTNDTVLTLANGAAGAGPLLGPHLQQFTTALTEVCTALAREIVADAEGASHVITMEIHGLQSESDARQIARTIAASPLVKTAIFGGDPNWGRILSAAGYAGVAFAEQEVSLWIGDWLVYDRGQPSPFDTATVVSYLRQNREVLIRLRFGSGPGSCRFWTCDLTYDYIRLNAEYTT